jgi:3-phenylpropionate/trans-cinnamate dioxygenase ferredoxin reductase subunit
VVVGGDLDARRFVAFWLRDGRVTAAMNVNVWDVADDLKALVLASGPVAPSRLADPAVPSTDLADLADLAG